MLGEEETIEERIAHFNLEIKKPFLTEPIQELDRAFNWKILFSLHLMYSTLHIHSLRAKFLFTKNGRSEVWRFPNSKESKKTKENL